MTSFWAQAREFHKRDDGQDMVEYALIAGLLALAAIASMKSLATSIKNAFGTIGTTITSNV
jgi:pilus assembly protein Flp/PilA